MAQLLILFTSILFGQLVYSAQLPRCLYISSYHQGYAWSDGLERGLKQGLRHVCEIAQYDMDTKRNSAPEHIRQSALKAKSIIEESNPDIVIVADDNAVKYVLATYYRNADTPFVFCGVNWTAEEYGLPYTNATGIIEVAPVKALYDHIRQLYPYAKRGIYIGANTITEQKNYRRFHNQAKRMELEITPYYTNTVDEWLSAYQHGQDTDFIILGSHAGIKDWEESVVTNAIKDSSKTLTLTSHGWMMPYSMLGLTKIPEEQGELAAEFAKSILQGTPIQDIYIIPNRRWDVWVNPGLLDAADITVPSVLRKKAKIAD